MLIHPSKRRNAPLGTRTRSTCWGQAFLGITSVRDCWIAVRTLLHLPKRIGKRLPRQSSILVNTLPGEVNTRLKGLKRVAVWFLSRNRILRLR